MTAMEELQGKKLEISMKTTTVMYMLIVNADTLEYSEVEPIGTIKKKMILLVQTYPFCVVAKSDGKRVTHEAVEISLVSLMNVLSGLGNSLEISDKEWIGKMMKSMLQRC